MGERSRYYYGKFTNRRDCNDIKHKDPINLLNDINIIGGGEIS